MNINLVPLAVVSAIIIISLTFALIDIKCNKLRHSCFDIARQMIREWNTYSDEKKIACAHWLSKLGIRVPAEMIPSV